MAINWTLYNTRLNINGTTKRERDLICLQSKITNNLPNSLSCKTVTINGVIGYLNFTETKTGYDIQSLPNETFSVGDYVVYKTINYLVTQVNGDDDVYTSGKMQECTYTLKFQHPTTGTILSYPCIDESSSSTGIDESNTINTLSGVKRIKVPFDENTKLIKVDDRFFVDRYGTTTYAVTNVNNTEFNYGDKGLIVLTMKADSAYNATTDKNGVCDYFEHTVEPEPVPSPSGYTLTITSSGDFNLGTTRTLTPILKDDLGNIVSDWIGVWNVDYNSMSQSWFVVDDTIGNNKCSVEVLDEAYDCIDGVLKLTCTVTGDTVSYTYNGMIMA